MNSAHHDSVLPSTSFVHIVFNSDANTYLGKKYAGEKNK